MDPEKARNLLLAKQAELRPCLNPKVAEDKLSVEDQPVDDGAHTAAVVDTVVAIIQLNLRSKLAAQVAAALQRIQLGEYGICTQCNEPIHDQRLKAVPWAPLCIDCAEIADYGQNGNVYQRQSAIA